MELRQPLPCVFALADLHPVLGPGDHDAYGDAPHLVVCPDCGQIEWWTTAELLDHGKCRATPGPCPVCAGSDEAA